MILELIKLAKIPQSRLSMEHISSVSLQVQNLDSGWRVPILANLTKYQKQKLYSNCGKARRHSVWGTRAFALRTLGTRFLSGQCALCGLHYNCELGGLHNISELHYVRTSKQFNNCASFTHSTIFHCLVNPSCHSAGKFIHQLNGKTLHWTGINKLLTM